MTDYYYNFALLLFIDQTDSIIGFNNHRLKLTQAKTQNKVHKLTFLTNPTILLKKESEKGPLQTYHYCTCNKAERC